MPSDAREELPKIAQLVELTSDAVAVCGHDGTIGHVNRRFCELAACHPDDLATPARVARVINAEALATRVLISQISPENRPAAQELVNLLNAPALLWE